MTAIQGSEFPRPASPIGNAEGGQGTPPPSSGPLHRSSTFLAPTKSSSSKGERNSPVGGTVSPARSDSELNTLQSSKSRQKKFHRHFKKVPPEEKVIDDYSCALVSDILLHGHLYITENYFAFYSNVFGYVTKILIPVCTVTKVTKERTAKVFPNAVGVVTHEGKHVFGSLMSRYTTYRVMVSVLRRRNTEDNDSNNNSQEGGVEAEEEEEDVPGGESGSESDTRPVGTDPPSPISRSAPPSPLKLAATPVRTNPAPSSSTSSIGLRLPSQQRLIAALLLMLMCSAGMLAYRISCLSTAIGQSNPYLSSYEGEEMFDTVARWQEQVHQATTHELKNTLQQQVQNLAQVRKSLESLSLMVMSGAKDDRS